MRDLYELWARQHLARDEDNIAALCSLLGSSTGRSLRLDGLQWVHQALSGETPADAWRRSETGAALLDFISVVLTEDVQAVSANTTARTALLALVALLVAKQVSAALALQERARRFLQSSSG